MAVTLYVTGSSPLPGGQKIVYGKFGMSSTYTEKVGDACNLSNYFLSTSYPIVTTSSTDGYNFNHNEGTAAAGKIFAYYEVANFINLAAVNRAFVEVQNQADLSAINVPFIAMGVPY